MRNTRYHYVHEIRRLLKLFMLMFICLILTVLFYCINCRSDSSLFLYFAYAVVHTVWKASEHELNPTTRQAIFSANFDRWCYALMLLATFIKQTSCSSLKCTSVWRTKQWISMDSRFQRKSLLFCPPDGPALMSHTCIYGIIKFKKIESTSRRKFNQLQAFLLAFSKPFLFKLKLHH